MFEVLFLDAVPFIMNVSLIIRLKAKFINNGPRGQLNKFTKEGAMMDAAVKILNLNENKKWEEVRYI